MSAELVYLDHAATTPVDASVLDAMLPYFGERFGNAASRQHALGRDAASAVEHAREQVAKLIGADAREIVFTSGATESNNLALKGVAGAPAYAREAKHVVTAVTEHHAVLDPLVTLEEEQGFQVTRLKVDGDGGIDLEQLARVLTHKPRLVSLMFGNNEIGVLHPVERIGSLCREHGVLFHTDATQAAFCETIDVEAQGIQLLSLSAHKLYGPKGIGALYLRRRGPRVRCRALIDGGGHERGVRSGTLNVPAIVGFGAAAELCLRARNEDRERIAALRDSFEDSLMQRLAGVARNGGADQRLAGITNLSFAGTDAESLLARLAGVAASSSSACTSASMQPSHVLRALGVGEERVSGSLRFSLGRGTTTSELERALDEIVAVVECERKDGPRDACRT